MTGQLDPIWLCCNRRASEHAEGLCPDGTFMCVLCWERLPVSAAVRVDEIVFNVCLTCRPQIDPR